MKKHLEELKNILILHGPAFLKGTRERCTYLPPANSSFFSGTVVGKKGCRKKSARVWAEKFCVGLKKNGADSRLCPSKTSIYLLLKPNNHFLLNYAF